MSTATGVEAVLLLSIDGDLYKVETVGERRFVLHREHTSRRYEVEPSRCACPGWRYRGSCKHQEALKAVCLM